MVRRPEVPWRAAVSSSMPDGPSLEAAGLHQAEKALIGLSSTFILLSPLGKLFGLLWLVAGAGIVGSGVGFLMGKAWWPALAISSAVVSLLVILPRLKPVPPGAWAGAGFDLLMLILLQLPLKDHLLAMAA